MTDETLAVLSDASGADTITVAGERGHHRVHTGPRPVQRPGPPIWIGGNGPAAIVRVNRFGTARHPLHPSRQTCAAGVERLSANTSFAPRVFFLPTERDVIAPDRPLGYGSLDQIGEDLQFLAGVGADTVVLDTDPGDQRLRRPFEDDLALVRLAGDRFARTM